MFNAMLNQDALPALPRAGLEGARLIDLEMAARIALAHGRDIWEHTIAIDAPLHIADTAGSLWAYAFPVAIVVASFPTHEAIFQAVRDARTAMPEQTGAAPFYGRIDERFGRFGTIYSSATQDDFPVLRVSHYLHPYFTHGEQAQAVADTHFELEPLVNLPTNVVRSRREGMIGFWAAPVSAEL